MVPGSAVITWLFCANLEFTVFWHIQVWKDTFLCIFGSCVWFPFTKTSGEKKLVGNLFIFFFKGKLK